MGSAALSDASGISDDLIAKLLAPRNPALTPLISLLTMKKLAGEQYSSTASQELLNKLGLDRLQSAFLQGWLSGATTLCEDSQLALELASEGPAPNKSLAKGVR